jgi:hypothetical protein
VAGYKWRYRLPFENDFAVSSRAIDVLMNMRALAASNSIIHIAMPPLFIATSRPGERRRMDKGYFETRKLARALIAGPRLDFE